MKVVCEKEIFASLVESKYHSMAKTIQKEKEEKKNKIKAQGLTKKNIKDQTSTISPNLLPWWSRPDSF